MPFYHLHPVPSGILYRVTLGRCGAVDSSERTKFRHSSLTRPVGATQTVVYVRGRPRTMLRVGSIALEACGARRCLLPILLGKSPQGTQWQTPCRTWLGAIFAFVSSSSRCVDLPDYLELSDSLSNRPTQTHGYVQHKSDPRHTCARCIDKLDC